MKKLKFFLVYGALFVALSCQSEESQPLSSAQEDKGAEAAKPLVEVIVEKVQKQPVFDPLLYAGTIFSKNTSKVYSQVEGVVEQVFVVPGERVKKGKKLFSIRPTGLRGQFNSSIVVAPRAGVFIGPSPNSYDYIKMNQLVAAVADTSDKRVRVHVPTSEYRLIEKADEKLIIDVLTTNPESEEGGSSKFSGEVVFVSATINAKTLSHEVEIQLSCKSHAAPQGCPKKLSELPMNSFVYVRLGTNYRQSIVLPDNVLQGSRDYVFTLNHSQSSTAKRASVSKKNIKLGADLGGKFEVVEGLVEGDEIVVSYSKKPKDGQKVTVQNIKPSTKKL